jgi:hypothetical protein
VRRAQFIEQAGILDRNYGLVRESGYKLDLFPGKGFNFLTEDRDRSDELAFLVHRYDEKGFRARKVGKRPDIGIAFDVGRLSPDVVSGTKSWPCGRIEYTFTVLQSARFLLESKAGPSVLPFPKAPVRARVMVVWHEHKHLPNARLIL